MCRWTNADREPPPAAADLRWRKLVRFAIVGGAIIAAVACALSFRFGDVLDTVVGTWLVYGLGILVFLRLLTAALDGKWRLINGWRDDAGRSVDGDAGEVASFRLLASWIGTWLAFIFSIPMLLVPLAATLAFRSGESAVFFHARLLTLVAGTTSGVAGSSAIALQRLARRF